MGERMSKRLLQGLKKDLKRIEKAKAKLVTKEGIVKDYMRYDYQELVKRERRLNKNIQVLEGL